MCSSSVCAPAETRTRMSHPGPRWCRMDSNICCYNSLFQVLQIERSIHRGTRSLADENHRFEQSFLDAVPEPCWPSGTCSENTSDLNIRERPFQPTLVESPRACHDASGRTFHLSRCAVLTSILTLVFQPFELAGIEPASSVQFGPIGCPRF